MRGVVLGRRRITEARGGRADLGPIKAQQQGLSYPGEMSSRSFAQHTFRSICGSAVSPNRVLKNIRFGSEHRSSHLRTLEAPRNDEERDIGRQSYLGLRTRVRMQALLYHQLPRAWPLAFVGESTIMYRHRLVTIFMH